MKAGEFDKAVDAGADVTGCLDISKARRSGQEQARVCDHPFFNMRPKEGPVDEEMARVRGERI